MKVLLINPPTVNSIRSEVPPWVKRDTGVFPPLGLLYLASAVREYTDHQVTLFDCVARGNDYAGLSRVIRELAPRVVGISAHTHNLVDVLRVADLAKRSSPAVLVCIGGPHTEVFPRETAGFENCDFVLRGEAELTFCRLLEAVESGSGYADVAGLYFRAGGSIAEAAAPVTVPALDSLPYPSRESLDPRLYYYALGRESSFTTIVTSRGCPYHCVFCAGGRKEFRPRSPENVVNEIEECSRLGIREIHFVDDTFNVSLDRVVSICEEIVRRKLPVAWTCRPRAQGFTREIMELLRRSGCRRIQIGVETGSDRGLQRLAKGVTLADVESTVACARDSGILTMAYFLIGCPHEKTAEDVLATIEFAVALNPDYCLFNILTLYPGTPIYQESIARGLVGPDAWREFARAPGRDFVVPVWDEFLSRGELARLLEIAYRKFYLRPRLVWRELKQLRSGRQLGRRIKSGLALLGRSGGR